MQNVIRCPNCRIELIAEEKKDHRCYGVVKEIPISYSCTLWKEGRNIIICKGLDGVLYKLVQTTEEA